MRMSTLLNRLLYVIGIATLCICSFFYGTSVHLDDNSVHADNRKPNNEARQPFQHRSRRINSVSSQSGPFDKPEKAPKPSGARINIMDKMQHEFLMRGQVYNERGVRVKLSVPLVSSLTYSFSPWVEKRVKLTFPDPKNENIFYANSPAIMWDNGELLVVLRIWLVKERYEAKHNYPENYFKDNYFYTQRFDASMRPLDKGRVMGIPTAGAKTVGDGPIEPRLFKANGRTLISFNTGLFFDWGMFDYTLIWDLTNDNMIIPEIEGGSPMLYNAPKNELPRDKHWSALIANNTLYFVQHLDPLRVMQCDLGADDRPACYCRLVYSQDDPTTFRFDDLKHHFRGGTPFELYSYPYYVSVSHVTLFKAFTAATRRVYTAHLVLMRIHPQFKIVYVSAAIQIHPELLRSVPIVRAEYIEDPFIFPVGLIVEDLDTVTVGVHISDYSSVLIRLRGNKKLFDKVIRHDRTEDANQQGPPVGTLQDFILNSVGNDTGYSFFTHTINNE